MSPTPYPEVNSLVHEVLHSARQALRDRFVGMYLDGSLANGGFDAASDIDFVVVTTEDITGELFLALQALHDRINRLDSPWAIQLEGSYLSRQAIRRYDPLHVLHPNLERGLGERIKMVDHGPWWAVHRWVLRERGITVVGPPPQSLIDPVEAEELRQASIDTLRTWGNHLIQHPEDINTRGYQSYVVLTLCRIQFTLDTGRVASKREAVEWGLSAWGDSRKMLIEQAWADRSGPGGVPSSEIVRQTVEMIREMLESSPGLL